jgi:hypothetical protein
MHLISVWRIEIPWGVYSQSTVEAEEPAAAGPFLRQTDRQTDRQTSLPPEEVWNEQTCLEKDCLINHRFFEDSLEFPKISENFRLQIPYSTPAQSSICESIHLGR